MGLGNEQEPEKKNKQHEKSIIFNGSCSNDWPLQLQQEQRLQVHYNTNPPRHGSRSNRDNHDNREGQVLGRQRHPDNKCRRPEHDASHRMR